MNQPAATVLFGTSAQTLVLDCPEGVPSSVTSVTVQDDTQADAGRVESATTGSASIDSASATLTASAGAGQANQSLLTVASVTGFAVKRRYLLTSVNGWREWIDAVGIDTTNKYLYARTALQNDYVSGDAVASPRISISFSTTWTNDASKLSGLDLSVYPWLTYLQRQYLVQLSPRPRWRVEWVYVVSGTTYRRAAFFDLVRYPLAHNVTAQDVDQLSRGWLFRLAGEDQGEADAIITEALGQVKSDLEVYDVAAYALRGNETLDELIRLKAIVIVEDAAFLHGAGNDKQREAARLLYRDRINELVATKSVLNVQISPDGSAGVQQHTSPLFER